MTNEYTRPERDHAPALTRGLKILDLVAAADDGLTMADISRALGIAKSSVHGLCTVMTNGGVLTKTPAGRFRLGLKIVDLARARLETSDLANEFHNRWAQMTRLSDEGAIIAVLDNTDVVYVACRNSKRSLGITFRIGMRLPARFTATGKAMLSTFSDREVQKLHRSSSWDPLTRNSIADCDELLRQLEDVRRHGYSIDDGETRTHMFSIGAPILMRDKAAEPSAVAISLIRSDVTDTNKNAAIDAVLELAADLSRAQVYY